jgi:Mycothiol maleylpyruvate isomerase N-terminal domain
MRAQPWDERVRDVRSGATREHRSPIAFLGGLTEDEWLAPSAAAGWTVRDLALHLLDDDLTWLSSARDGDTSRLVGMSDRSAFPRLLAAKNQRWIDGACGLSRRVVTELLDWSGEQVDALHATQDLGAEGWVSWGSDGPVPYWFNLAQELTERWVHQQQMREAVGRVDEHAALLPEVLRTFVWAFPHQFRAAAEAGTQVEISLGAAGVWTLTSDGAARWTLAPQRATCPRARLTLTSDAAWRQLTGAAMAKDSRHAEGDPALLGALARVRAIVV